MVRIRRSFMGTVALVFLFCQRFVRAAWPGLNKGVYSRLLIFAGEASTGRNGTGKAHAVESRSASMILLRLQNGSPRSAILREQNWRLRVARMAGYWWALV